MKPSRSSALLEALPYAVSLVKARQRRGALPPPDPAGFAVAGGIEPDPWQSSVLRSTSPSILLNCSRQSGKSTVSAVLTMHTALYHPGALVLLLSPSQRQSSELFKKCTAVYHAAGRPVDQESETALTLTLDNGSRVVSLPGTEGTVRGYSGVDLLVVDEAARVADALYYAVRPMLAVSGGRLVALSSPFGKRGWFYDAWENGGDAWERYKVTAAECPRISAAFLDDERNNMPAIWYTQEYECEFTETIDQMFGHDLVASAMTADVAPLFGATRVGTLHA